MIPIRSRSWQKLLPPSILFVSLLVIYLLTLAPGLTWAHDGSDGGDLIAAAATGGVAHPSGYPLYLLVARLFQLLPIGSLAFRTNLLSALAMAAAAALVYQLVVTDAAGSRETHDWPVGLAAGFAFGLAPLVWSQAVITEVYGLQALLIALVLLLYAEAAPVSIPTGKRLDRWRGLALGLAMCNHASTLLVVPAALLVGALRHREEASGSLRVLPAWMSDLHWDRRSFLTQLGTWLAALSLYLLLPLRAMTDPLINWGNVVTPQRFWWLVSAELYRAYYLQFSPAEIGMRLQQVAAMLLQQFGLPGLALGFAGLIVFGKRSRLFVLTAWSAMAFTTLAVIYSSTDSYVYLIPALVAFAVWIGKGITGLSNQAAGWSWSARTGLSFLLIGYMLARSAMQVHELDASRDQRAETFGRVILATAPQQAILFAQGDQAVFALWYFHFALEERPDLVVIAEDLLHFDWYQENLRAAYPSLQVPGPFPWTETIAEANPARAICYVRYTDGPEIDCSPPLDPGAGE